MQTSGPFRIKACSLSSCHFTVETRRHDVSVASAGIDAGRVCVLKEEIGPLQGDVQTRDWWFSFIAINNSGASRRIFRKRKTEASKLARLASSLFFQSSAQSDCSSPVSVCSAGEGAGGVTCPLGITAVSAASLEDQSRRLLIGLWEECRFLFFVPLLLPDQLAAADLKGEKRKSHKRMWQRGSLISSLLVVVWHSWLAACWMGSLSPSWDRFHAGSSRFKAPPPLLPLIYAPWWSSSAQHVAPEPS